MGNCQVVDAAAATVEHPGGKVEKLYWTLTARQLMLQNPGYYVALLPLPPSPGSPPAHCKKKLNLLPPDAILHIGHCYRLVTFEDVLGELSERSRAARQGRTQRSLSKPSVDQFAKSTNSTEQAVSTNKAESNPVPHVRSLSQFRALVKATTTTEEDRDNRLDTVSTPASNYRTLPPARSMYRHGQWRPCLQSIAEQGR